MNDGIRFNWNLFPSTRLEASLLGTPLGCLYLPLEANLEIPEGSIPFRCDTCSGYINPFIKLDRANGMWWCPLCEKRSFLPQGLAIPQSNENIWPIELQQGSTVIEYNLPNDVSTSTSEDLPLAFTFIIDLYEYIDERTPPSFPHLLVSLRNSIDLIPIGSLINIITYDDVVHVQNFAGPAVSFPGNFVDSNLFTESTVDSVITRLGLTKELPADWKESPLVLGNYFAVLTASNRDQIKSKIMSIEHTPTSIHKPLRSSGLANYLSTIILKTASYRNFIGKTFQFVSGPCTNFPGKIVSPGETIRSHHDILELNAPDFAALLKFYRAMGYIANGQEILNAADISSSVSYKTTSFYVNPVSPTWSVSLFTGSPDQVGVYEIKPLVSSTMGQIHLFPSFSAFQLPSAIASCIKGSAFKNRLTVVTSAGLKISKLVGSIGYALPSSYKTTTYHQKIADTLTTFDSATIKNVFTNQWQFNALNDETLCLLFEMNTVRSSKEIATCPKQVFLQFQLKYWDSLLRKWKLRVTTSCMHTTASIEKPSLILRQHKLLKSFDQECFVVILARLLINKIDTTLGFDKFESMVKVLDQTLVKVLYHFGGGGGGGQAETSENPYQDKLYQLNESCMLLPTLVYNLRRSPQLIRIFNSSPDETAMYHAWFSLLSCALSIIAIEPRLYKVEEGTFSRIPLDPSCLNGNDGPSFLVLDSIFHRIIYANFPLQLHPSDNDHLLIEREPSILVALKFVDDLPGGSVTPKFVITRKGHSQARYLISMLNPSEVVTVAEEGFWSGLFKRKLNEYEGILTDEMSFDNYYSGVVKLIRRYRVESDS